MSQIRDDLTEVISNIRLITAEVGSAARVFLNYALSDLDRALECIEEEQE